MAYTKTTWTEATLVDVPKLQKIEDGIEGNENNVETHKAQNVNLGSSPHGVIYEKGTWTPSLAFLNETSGITYSVQKGFYTRENNMCHVSGRLVLSGKGTNAGGATIRGLPFQFSDVEGDTVSSVFHIVNTSLPNNTYVPMLKRIGSTTVVLEGLGSDIITQMGNIHFSNTSEIRFNFWYQI